VEPHGNASYSAEIARDIYSQGWQLLQAGRTRAAAFQFEKALCLSPGFSDAALALGHCLHSLGESGQALTVYDRLLTASPTLVAAWNNRGNTLLEMCRYQEAADSFSRALEMAPGLHDTRVALATCWQALGRLAEAMTACDTVLAAAPDNAEAHWNRGLLHLLQGDYCQGWREYEWRWQKRGFTSPRRDFPQPRWQGEQAAGQTILIHAEQGFGDTLQFCRYIPLVAARGLRVIFECHPPLVALMQGLPGVSEVIPMRRPVPAFDLHLPLMSLPLLFETTVETIPVATPYLVPPADRLPLWRGLVLDENRLKVGLCWAGKSYPDPRRSCPAALLEPLIGIENVSWYSLQLGWKEALPLSMNDTTGQINDFSDTAALISQLDLVITVDTAVAHLAGALGKPTWLLLPQAPDWRWMLNREDSPWYPTIRILRQKSQKGWEETIQRVKNLLYELQANKFQTI